MRVIEEDTCGGLGWARRLRLSESELRCLRRASDIASRARELLRQHGIEEGHGVDDLLALRGSVIIDDGWA